MSEARGPGTGTAPTGAPRPLNDRPASSSTALVPVRTEPVDAPEAPATRRFGPWRWPANVARPSRTVPVVAAVLALAIGGVVIQGSGEDGPGPGEALVEVDGTAVVHRAGGGVETVTDRTRLGPGDRIRVRSGSAELELADGVRFSAVDAAGGRPATDVQMARVPLLRSGPLLVVAPDGTTLRSGAGEVRLGAAGAARVTRTAAVGVDVFRGRAELRSAGTSQEVPALRRAEIVAAGELTRARPLTYRSSDGWDRRYLGDALALDRQLASLRSGMQADRTDGSVLAERLRAASTDSVSAAELRRFLAEREGALDAALGVAVVGAADGSSYRDRWDRAFGFHDAGARWGLVGMDLEVEPDAVIDALGRALRNPSGLSAGEAGDELASGPIDPATGLPTSSGAPAGGTSVAEPGTVGGAPVTTAAPAAPVTVPAVEPPAVTVPVTVPGVTLPPVTAPPLPVVTTLVDVIDGATGGVVTGLTGTLGGVLGPVTAPLTCTPGVLGPVTGTGGLLGGVTGSGGLLPLCP